MTRKRKKKKAKMSFVPARRGLRPITAEALHLREGVPELFSLEELETLVFTVVFRREAAAPVKKRPRPRVVVVVREANVAVLRQMR